MRGDCHNALLGRDTTSNVTFQAEFFPGGDFEYRYEDRTLRYRVIVPYDWDDDGLANGIDPEPYASNGDCHGQGEGWVEACFTNAAEIATAGGFASWVNNQVGEGLTNGLYLITAAVPDLGSNICPEPGFIAGRPSPRGIGHCGIVDYDGWTISARQNGISRNADKMLDGTCGYNKPEVANGNTGNN